MIAYKVFTSRLCSPIQGGEPIWDGSLPFSLPPVVLDNSGEECAAGWNAAPTPEAALKIAGLWSGGKPSRLFLVEAASPLIRGDKLRAETWTVLEELDVRDIIPLLSTPFGVHAKEMVREQIAWYDALGRPQYHEGAVRQGLNEALHARSLTWSLDQKPDARAARAARAAWDAWDARAARDALMHYYAVLRGWINPPANRFTVGIRDAYKHGLDWAFPVAKNTLSWAMKEAKP